METALSLREIQCIVGRITYKPGWKIVVDGEPWERFSPIMFHLTWSAFDATGQHPGMIPVQLTQMAYRDEFYNERDVVRFVFECIRQAEQHETDEFFKLDGRCVHAPH